MENTRIRQYTLAKSKDEIVLAEKDVKQIAAGRNLLKTSAVGKAMFTIQILAIGLALAGAIKALMPVMASGFVLWLVPMLVMQLQAKKAQEAFVRYWRDTGKIYPEEWRYHAGPQQ